MFLLDYHPVRVAACSIAKFAQGWCIFQTCPNGFLLVCNGQYSTCADEKNSSTQQHLRDLPGTPGPSWQTPCRPSSTA